MKWLRTPKCFQIYADTKFLRLICYQTKKKVQNKYTWLSLGSWKMFFSYFRKWCSITYLRTKTPYLVHSVPRNWFIEKCIQLVTLYHQFMTPKNKIWGNTHRREWEVNTWPWQGTGCSTIKKLKGVKKGIII